MARQIEFYSICQDFLCCFYLIDLNFFVINLLNNKIYKIIDDKIEIKKFSVIDKIRIGKILRDV